MCVICGGPDVDVGCGTMTRAEVVVLWGAAAAAAAAPAVQSCFFLLSLFTLSLCDPTMSSQVSRFKVDDVNTLYTRL